MEKKRRTGAYLRVLPTEDIEDNLAARAMTHLVPAPYDSSP